MSGQSVQQVIAPLEELDLVSVYIGEIRSGEFIKPLTFVDRYRMLRPGQRKNLLVVLAHVYQQARDTRNAYERSRPIEQLLPGIEKYVKTHPGINGSVVGEIFGLDGTERTAALDRLVYEGRLIEDERDGTFS